MRSKGINYMNRPKPNDFFGKRPPQMSSQAPANKVQRNFHLDATNYVPGEPYDQDYPPEGSEIENGEPEYLQEYYRQMPEEEVTIANKEDQPINISDLHFLG